LPNPIPPTIDDERQFTLAVLAGGEGSRMGRAKGELLVDGRPILVYLLKRLAWVGPTLLVTAPGRERPPGAERFGREVVDPVTGEGPLRGVLTALEAAETSRVVVVTVDMPGVTREVLHHLLAAMRGPSLGAMCERKTDQGPQIEPFPTALSRGAAEIVRDALAAGRRSVWSMTKDPRFAVIPAPPEWTPLVWANLNRADDVAAFAAAARVRVELPRESPPQHG